MGTYPNSRNPIARFFSRPYRYAAVFSVILLSAFVFTLLDAFVIPRALRPASPNDAALVSMAERPSATDDGNAAADDPDMEGEVRAAPVVTATSYQDQDIEISIETLRVYDTDVYIADVKISRVDYLKTAFPNNTYGRNIGEKTSVIAREQNAIFAVNGDFYGFRDDGWVLRNGVLYRRGEGDAALLTDKEGDFACESDSTLIKEQLQSLWQVWSFGPPLVVDGAIAVTENQEISGRSANSNPRTATGQIEPLHYLFIVSDGRTSESAGLSLYELAALFEARGCRIAYNLDGGGSSAMVFNGQVVNRPTTGGRRIGEREVSDIVYIGY